MQGTGNRRWSVLAVVLILALFGAGTLFATGQEDQGVPAVKPTITFLMSDMGRTKFTKDTYVVQILAEHMGNVDLELVLIPRSERASKFSTMIAGGDLPDIMMVEGAYDIAMEYGPRGLFYKLETKLNKMPELAKIRKAIPEYDKVMFADDGHMYAFSWVAPFKFFTFGILASPTFQKVGVDPRKNLETIDDLYAALKKIKSLDPGNFPWTTRAGNDFGRTWLMFGTDMEPYPDAATGAYVYGPVENRYRKMLEYLAKAYADGILHPDFFTMKEETWRELFAAAKTHFTIDNFSQATTLGTDPKNPTTWLTAILAPKVDGVRYWASMDRGSVSPAEGLWMINAKTKYIDNLIKFCDWGYSEEGFNDVFYGRVGEVSTVTPDGYRKFVIPEGKTFPNVWKGEETINSLGLRQYPYVFRNALHDNLNPYATEQTGGDVRSINWQIEVTNYYTSNNALKPWKPLLKYTVDELDTVKQLRTPIETLAKENSIKFIRGEKPFSEWDKHVADIKAMGLDRLLKVYNAAYARFQKAK